MNTAILPLTWLALLAPPVETAPTPSTRLYVRTIPPGAEVKLDGKAAGKSDQLFVVPPGVSKMTIEVELDEHYPEKQEVEVRGGRITRVELKLRKRAASPEAPAAGVAVDPKARVRDAVTAISTCAEGDPRVAAALKTLQGLDQKMVATELAGFLDEKQDAMRRAAIYILWNGKFTSIEPAVAGLLKLCDHREDFTRGMAAIALGANKVEKSFPALVAIARKDTSSYARRCAAYALGLLGDKKAIPALKELLRDSDVFVHDNAQAALTLLGAKAEENGDGSTPRGPGIDFRAAPTRGGEKPLLSEDEINRYVEHLKAKGPGGPKSEGAFAWFEVAAADQSNLITAAYKDRRYMLLSNRPNEVMLWQNDSRGAWGLKRVSAAKGPGGHLMVEVEFDKAGGERFAALTEACMNRPLAILIGGQVISAPLIRSRIADKAQITGRFTEEDVQRLVRSLTAGMLKGGDGPPAPQSKPDQPLPR